MRGVVVLELNEVPWRILDDHCRAQPKGAFARLVRTSRCHVGATEDQGHLSPWITWPTLHRGVTGDRHGIRNFGEDLRDVDRAYPPVWALLARAGVRTGIFHCLHSHPVPRDRASVAFHVPDPFAPDADCHPAEVRPFQELTLAASRASGLNVSRRIPVRAAVDVLARSRRLGLRARTLASAAAQVVAEVARPARVLRRRTLQAVLAFDVHARLLERTQPAYSAFFTNHVASAMHRYWVAAHPEDYAELGHGAAWVATHRDEIPFAMRRADAMVDRLMRFVAARPGWCLVVAASMGQAATRSRLTPRLLSLRHPQRLMDALGQPTGSWERRPAMEPQFNFAVPAGRADAVGERLRGLRLVGAHLEVESKPGGFFSLGFGEPAAGGVAVELDGRRLPLADVGLEEVDVQDEAGSCAYHVPEGVLIVHEPGTRPDDGRARVPTTAVAPWVLARLGVEPPAHMAAARDL